MITPYGKVTVRDANFSADADGKSDIGNEFLFTGRRLDAETGFYYFRNRYYSCETGRFVTVDPIRYNGSKWNLYGAYFVPGGVDPWGLSSFIVGDFTPPYKPDAGAGVHGSQSSTQIDEDAGLALLIGISVGGWFNALPDARDHLAHYLGNSGREKQIRLQVMINDVPSAKKVYNRELEEAMAFVESLPVGEYLFSSTRVRTGYNEEKESANWYFAVGGYQVYGEGFAKVTCDKNGKKSYSMHFLYRFRDRYNWDTGKSVTIAGIKITDKAMGRFHRVGIAKEFEMRGIISKTYKWKQGPVPAPSTQTGTPGSGRPPR